ncbi:MAG TPA: hypothetical protein VFA52_01815 [Candidatus Paceibacterota bacterium]|nr:hypothetical protein [Candidatus Paceibacterota bacterium]
MRARALQLNRTGSLNRLESPVVFWGVILALILFVGIYGYLVNKTVWNVVARQRAEKNITLLNTQLGSLESNYMSLKNNINLNLAHSLGFSQTTDTKYINRPALGRLSSNTVE